MSRRVMGAKRPRSYPISITSNCLCLSGVIYSVVDNKYTNAGIVGIEQYIEISLMHLTSSFIIFYSVLYLYT